MQDIHTYVFLLTTIVFLNTTMLSCTFRLEDLRPKPMFLKLKVMTHLVRKSN